MNADANRSEKQPLVPPGGFDLHARDMTATLSADLSLADVQAKLAAIGQWLPVDGDASLSIGQLVSRNSTGPLRLGYGAWRDLLLGAQFLNGGDELITAGGRTVKNVAGYDLTKFMVGQAGAFGRLVTLTTRTYVGPAGSILAHFPAEVSLVGKLLPTPCRPQWMMLTANSLWCGYLGDEATLGYYGKALAAYQPIEIARRNVNQDIAFRAATWRSAGSAPFRASVPPARVMDFVNLTRPMSWAADAAFGTVIGSLDTASSAPRPAAAAKDVGGTLVFLSDEGAPLKTPGGATELALLERIKVAFDPDGKLASLPAQTEGATR